MTSDDPARDGARTASITRRTGETDVSVEVDLDGRGDVTVETGLGFLDHMITALFLHGRFDGRVRTEGDLDVDDHHTVEDTALVIGAAVDEALGNRAAIRRFADAHAPLDEALARAVVDFSGRPHASVDLGLRRERIGAVATENLGHFIESFAMASRATIHVDVLRGVNDHHRAEAAFKALALALRQAVSIDPIPRMPSTKGTLG